MFSYFEQVVWLFSCQWSFRGFGFYSFYYQIVSLVRFPYSQANLVGVLGLVALSFLIPAVYLLVWLVTRVVA